MFNYSELLKNPLWQRKRLEIMNRDNFCCQMCGDNNDTLHVHHHYYMDGALPWEYPDHAYVTYCYICHQIVEKVKKTEYSLLSISKASEQVLPYSLALARDKKTKELLILAYWFNERDKEVYLFMKMNKERLNGLINLIEMGKNL